MSSNSGRRARLPISTREMAKKGGKKSGGGDDTKGTKASKCPPGVDPEYFAMTTVRYPARRESENPRGSGDSTFPRAYPLPFFLFPDSAGHPHAREQRAEATPQPPARPYVSRAGPVPSVDPEPAEAQGAVGPRQRRSARRRGARVQARRRPDRPSRGRRSPPLAPLRRDDLRARGGGEGDSLPPSTPRQPERHRAGKRRRLGEVPRRARHHARRRRLAARQARMELHHSALSVRRAAMGGEDRRREDSRRGGRVRRRIRRRERRRRARAVGRDHESARLRARPRVSPGEGRVGHRAKRPVTHPRGGVFEVHVRGTRV